MSRVASIVSIGVSEPRSTIDAAVGAELASNLAHGSATDADARSRLASLYRECGVARRGCVLAGASAEGVMQQVMTGPGPSTSMRLGPYLDAAAGMAAEAAGDALADAGFKAGDVTHLITVSCTGAGSPGIDHRLIEMLGLSRDVRRTHVGFMGCHGAINALAVAAAIAESRPGAVVLVACTEVCSLHYQVGGARDQDVANAIFADGAACAVVTAAESPLASALHLQRFGSRVFPGTADLMSWEIGDRGFEMRLSPRVPGVLRRHIGAWVDEWLETMAMRRDDVAAWAVHPGGRDVLEGVRRGLGLDPGALSASERVLREHGNMSSGTVLWVLADMLRSRGLERGACIAALAFGPGLSGEAMLLSVGGQGGE